MLAMGTHDKGINKIVTAIKKPPVMVGAEEAAT